MTDSEVNEEPGCGPGLRGWKSLRSPQASVAEWLIAPDCKSGPSGTVVQIHPGALLVNALVVQRTARRNPDPQVAGSTPAESAIAKLVIPRPLRHWRPSGACAPADTLSRAPTATTSARTPLAPPGLKPTAVAPAPLPRPESPLWPFRPGSRRRPRHFIAETFSSAETFTSYSRFSFRLRKSIRANGLAAPGDGKSADARPPKASRLT